MLSQSWNGKASQELNGVNDSITFNEICSTMQHHRGAIQVTGIF